MLAPELLLRHLVQTYISFLTTEDGQTFMAAVFAHEDVLASGSDSTFSSRLFSALSKNTPVVALNYPEPQLVRLPCITILESDTQESQAFVGDSMFEAQVFDGGFDDDQTLQAFATSEVLGYMVKCDFKMIVTTNDAEFTAGLARMLSLLLFLSKMTLERTFTVCNMAIQESDFLFPQDYWPLLTWSKSLNLSFEMQRRIFAYDAKSFPYTEDWDAVRRMIRALHVVLEKRVASLHTDVE